jgi:dihydropteroate synthase
MEDALYLRPTGLLYGRAASAALRDGKAGALAGGHIAFASVHITVGNPSSQSSEIRNYDEISASNEGAIAAALLRITSPRPAVAGLALTKIRIMGVVNVTPDSFSDGGLYNETDQAISHAAQLVSAGADIVDIGGESTRPGAETVDDDDECRRVLPVITGLRGNRAKISIDTRKASVMAQAADAGADIINDVSALSHDPKSMSVAKQSNLPIVLMHAKADPKSMQNEAVYDDVLLEVFDYLAARIEACKNAGIERERLIADPGIGFGKHLEQNLQLCEGLSLFHALGVPLMVGVSRKSFIGTVTGEKDPREREAGSIAAALAGVAQGVQIVRVHDVKATVQAQAVWQAVTTGKHAKKQ